MSNDLVVQNMFFGKRLIVWESQLESNIFGEYQFILVFHLQYLSSALIPPNKIFSILSWQKTNLLGH